MLPPMPQINLIFLGSSNSVSFEQGSTSVLHPPIAQVPTDQLPAPHTFEHALSPLPRQCSVQEGCTGDSIVVGVGTKNKKKIKSSKLPIQSSLPRVIRAATRLQFGPLTESDIDFPTLPISHSSECGNNSCPSILTALPQEFEVPQPSSNVHSSFVVPNVGSSCVAPNLVHTFRSLLR